jgi:hypothetical protein
MWKFIFITLAMVGCGPMTVQVCDGDRCGTGWIKQSAEGGQTVQTAAHAIGTADEVRVFVPARNYLGPYVLRGTVTAREGSADLALVKVRGWIGRPLKTCDPVPGETVTAYGQDGSGPTRSARTIRSGRLVSVYPGGAVGDFISEPKMSGAPVMSDRRRCVIGWAVRTAGGYTEIRTF